MGNCLHCHHDSSIALHTQQLEKEIDQKNEEFEIAMQQQKCVHHILLVGPGESGKSSILNQIRQLHGTLTNCLPTYMITQKARRNIPKFMAILCVQITKLGISMTDQESIDHSKRIVSYAVSQANPNGDGDDQHYPQDLIQSIKYLWKNEPAIKECLKNRHKFQIDDNVSYFFDSIDRIYSPNYSPSDQDMINIRIRTGGFSEEKFTLYFDEKQLIGDKINDGACDGNFDPNDGIIIPNEYVNQNFNGGIGIRKDDDNDDHDPDANQESVINNKEFELEMKRKKFAKREIVILDVGGARSERRKWMTVIGDDDQIDAVWYLVAIGDFDITCFEDYMTNRLDEALSLFEACATNGILNGRMVSILFIKYDEFKTKLENKENNFKFYFADYTGDTTNADDIIAYVYRKFDRIYQQYTLKRDMGSLSSPLQYYVLSESTPLNYKEMVMPLLCDHV